MNCKEGGDRDPALGVKYGYGCGYYIEIAQSTSECAARKQASQRAVKFVIDEMRGGR